MRRGLTVTAAAGAMLAAQAGAQTGEFRWSGLGVADEAGVPDNATYTDPGTGITTTVDWYYVSNGQAANPDGTGDAPSFVPNNGADFLSYETERSGVVAAGTGWGQVSFDTDDGSDQGDYVVVILRFNEAVTDAAFRVLDADQANFDDFAAVFVQRPGQNFQNVRGARHRAELRRREHG